MVHTAQSGSCVSSCISWSALVTFFVCADANTTAENSRLTTDTKRMVMVSGLGSAVDLGLNNHIKRSKGVHGTRSQPSKRRPWSSVGCLLIDRPKKKVTRALNRHSIQPCFLNKWTGATSFMPYVERSAGRCGILDLSDDKNLIVEPGDWSYWWSYEQTFPLPT